jgi:hypothetical protein
VRGAFSEADFATILAFAESESLAVDCVGKVYGSVETACQSRLLGSLSIWKSKAYDLSAWKVLQVFGLEVSPI